MTRRSWIQLLAVAALWGASYLFIKVALDDVSPAVVVFTRTALAALALLPIALHMKAFAGLRDRLGAVALLTLLQVAAPFALIATGEQAISSSLAGILVAAAPIFTVLLAMRLEPGDRVRGVGLVGVALGIAGVVVLLGVDTRGGTAALVGGGLVVLAGLGYALGSFHLRRNLREVAPIGLVSATMGLTALVSLPFAALSAPEQMPGAAALGSLAALGILGSGIAFVLFFTLIAEVGASRASLVGYIAPGFAVIYGVVLLGEPVSAATFAGLALILGGSWLAADGRVARLRRNAPRASAHGRPLEVTR